MKRIFTITIALLIFGHIDAQSIDRALEDFNFLSVKNALEVELTQGDKNQVSIIGISPEDADKIKTEVSNGELSITTDGKIKSKDAIVVQLTFKNLRGIRQSGASEISSTNAITGDKFSLNGSGAIEADLMLAVRDLSVDFSGASDIKLEGTADNFELKLSGASDLKASGLAAKKVVVDVSGASDVKVFASESITGNAKGASNINVKGNPPVRAINSSTSSDASYYGNENVSVRVGNTHVEVNDDNVSVHAGNNNVDVRDDSAMVVLGGTVISFIGDSVHIQRKEKKRRNHWAGVDLGINGFMTSGGSMDLSNPSHFAQNNPKKVTQFMELDYSKSWTVSVNFLEFYVPIKSHHFGLVTGLGTEWNNYELKHNVALTPEGGAFVHNQVDGYNNSYTWGEIDTVTSYSKNRFKTWFINAPLLLEVNTGNHKNKSFHLSAGAILGYNLQTKMKYKYTEEDGDTKKVKDKDSFNTNPFRVSLTARAGVGWFNVFATYALTPLFESGRGPELYPFTVGVTLLGF